MKWADLFFHNPILGVYRPNGTHVLGNVNVEGFVQKYEFPVFKIKF